MSILELAAQVRQAEDSDRQQRIAGLRRDDLSGLPEISCSAAIINRRKDKELPHGR